MMMADGPALTDELLKWFLAIFGAGGGGMLLQRWNSRRRERAEANNVEVEVDRKVSEAWRAYAEKLEAEMAKMREEINALRRENEELRRRILDLENHAVQRS